MNQKTTKRAITALVAVLTLALVSAACNNGGSPTSPATNLQAKTTIQAPATQSSSSIRAPQTGCDKDCCGFTICWRMVNANVFRYVVTDPCGNVVFRGRGTGTPSGNYNYGGHWTAAPTCNQVDCSSCGG